MGRATVWRKAWLEAAVGASLLVLGAGPVVGAMVGPVRTQSGLVSGAPSRWVPSVAVFKGIPFAAPPVGKLRFRPPQPPRPWHGVHAADRFGPVCPQLGRPAAQRAAMSENCLFLNIWTAAPSSAPRRPVFVWIFGGGFQGGAGSDPQFDGAGLARKGLVVVTFNYRLGPLGFLATPALDAESPHHVSGDYGLLDMIAVLDWVHRNIAAFGGDPSRVTIAGQSSGGGSVGFLDMSPLAAGLFQRAITESHQRDPHDPELRYLSTSYRTKKNAERQGIAYAKAHGATTLQELRAMPWRRLLEGSTASDESVDTGSPSKPPLFRPVIDGWVLPHDYSQTYQAGLQTNVSYLVGNNRDESGAVPDTAFAPLRELSRTTGPRGGAPEPVVTLAQYRAAARRKFGPMTGEFLQLYPAATDQEAALANDQRVRDNSRISTFLWAELRSRHMSEPIFTYFWDHAPPGPSHDLRGAFHGSEISYVFDNLYATKRPWTATDRRIAQVMSSYWVSFAASGNPNGKGVPYWPPFDANRQVLMELGDHFGPIPVASSQARLEFWRRYFSTQTAW